MLVRGVEVLVGCILFLVFFIIALITGTRMRAGVASVGSLFGSCSDFGTLGCKGSFASMGGVGMTVGNAGLGVCCRVGPKDMLEGYSMSFSIRGYRFRQCFSSTHGLSVCSGAKVSCLRGSC